MCVCECVDVLHMYYVQQTHKKHKEAGRYMMSDDDYDHSAVTLHHNKKKTYNIGLYLVLQFYCCGFSVDKYSR